MDKEKFIKSIRSNKDDSGIDSNEDVSFNEINVRDAEILQVDLDELISVKSIYQNVKFENVSMYSGYLVETTFVNSLFINVVFTKSILHSIKLINCTFRESSFFRAEIIGGCLIGCKFEKCDFSNITFCNNKIIDSIFDIKGADSAAIIDNKEIDSDWLLRDN